MKIWTSFLIFFILIGIGISLASRKQLWTDELYSQKQIETIPFSELIKGKLNKAEGNPCPLFYLNQKMMFSLIKFKFPIPWKGEFCIYEPASQIIIRILNIIYVSLGLTIVYYIFGHYYSLRTGILALLMFLSNPMVWLYWAEARPYGLWFLLTIIQCSLLLSILNAPQKSNYWIWLYLIHILLSMTIILTLPQILFVSLTIWVVQKLPLKKTLCHDINSVIDLQFLLPSVYKNLSLASHKFPWQHHGCGLQISSEFKFISTSLVFNSDYFKYSMGMVKPIGSLPDFYNVPLEG